MSEDRYWTERSRRGIREPRPAARGGDDREVGVTGDLVTGDDVQARVDLREDEKGNGRGNPDIPDESANGVEGRRAHERCARNAHGSRSNSVIVTVTFGSSE